MYNQEWIAGSTPTSPQGEKLRTYATSFGLVPKHRELTWFPQGGGGDSVDYALCSEKLRCSVRLLEKRGEHSDHKPFVLLQDKTFCSICQVAFNYVQDLESHTDTPKHRINFLLKSYQKHKDKFRCNPHQLGLEMSLKDPAAGVVQSIEEPGVINIIAEEMVSKHFKISLKNVGVIGEEKGDNSKDEGLVIDRIGLLRPDNSFTLADENRLTEGRTKIKLIPSRSYKIDVTCLGNQIGQHKGVLMVSFYDELHSAKDEASGKYVLHHMAVELNFKIVNSELREIKRGAPYERPRPFSVWKVTETIPGTPLDFVGTGGPGGLKRAVPLNQSFISKPRRALIQAGFESNGSAEQRREAVKCVKLMSEPLNANNYQERIQLLLHCEELQMEYDIRHYDMLSIPVDLEQRGRKRLIKIRVPGLAENRPSVLKGDRIYLKKINTTTEFEGFVDDVGEQDVFLAVNTRLTDMFVKNMKFDVRFTINRFPLRNMHRAVEFARKEGGFMESIFPTRESRSAGPAKHVTPFNRLVEGNTAQMLAVSNIVGRSSGTAPYVIFGPPGTGKTITLVESIKQIWKLEPGAHILAAAPSNAAADLIAERLKEHVPKGKLFRFHAPSRNTRTLNQKILDISNMKNGELFTPSMEELAKYSIVIVTLCTAGRLVSAKFPVDHFSHVFIDECGHATEPEAVIALAGILDPARLRTNGQIVLAGDPKQLGPVLRSAHAKSKGLDVSLLERLMGMDLYSPSTTSGAYNNKYITKLVNNFRSHPAILSLPSRLYYNNDLVAAADPVLVNSMLDFPGLPGQARGKFPVVFHSVIGEDQQEERSPSFFNPEEVAMTVKYVKQILDLKANKIKAKEIGIISPYRRQVEKLREQLYSKGPEFRDITIGSTEEFQGQERRVIIISCVRSQVQYVKTDHQYKLGFLKNSKRFNVAITRAKALMIIIGNPHILGQDPDWRAMIEYTQENGGFTGAPYSIQRNADLDRLEQGMQRLLLEDSAELSPVTQYEEPAWRADI